jgi:hypothetical protein
MSGMTREEVVKSVQWIKDHAHDPEAAHAAEDRLYLEIVMMAARSSDRALASCAEAALAAGKIGFSRWCA